MYDAKRSKLLKRTKVLWSFSDPCDPSVFPKPRSPQCCRPHICWKSKKANKHLLISLCGDVHICKQFFLNWIPLRSVGRESEKRKHWHYMYSIRFSRQSFLTTENTLLRKFSSSSGDKASSPWLNPYVRPIFVKGQKRWYFCQILTHKFQFGKTCNAELLRF